MNSLLKNNTQNQTLISFDYLKKFQDKVSKMSNREEVLLLQQKLKYLGLHYNPFSPHQETPEQNECHQIMTQLELLNFSHNPFEVTNLLLRLIDLLQEKLNHLHH